jgi:predicted dinucleotide-utilizing enzyme
MATDGLAPCMQVPDAALHAALARKWDEAIRKLEREIVRDKDLEREASLQAMAARAKLELDAAVLAAKLTCEQQHAAALPSLVAARLAGAVQAAVAAAQAEERAVLRLQRSQRARAARWTVRAQYGALTGLLSASPNRLPRPWPLRGRYLMREAISMHSANACAVAAHGH